MRLLGLVLALAIVVAVIEVAHPKGVVGLLHALLDFKPVAAPSTPIGTAAAPAAKPAEPAKVEAAYGPGASQELSWADRDYDRGDFDGAVANYGSSRVLSANADERYRANKGLEKSLLAWAIARGAPKVNGTAAELEGTYRKQLAAAEASSDEKLWIDLVRWTAGAGLRDRLPYVVGQALDRARPGGHVQAVLDDSILAAGSKRELLAGAMAARGLGKGVSLVDLPVSGGGAHAAAGGSSGIGGTTKTAGEESGIGGVNTRGVPFGHFTAEMRTKLRAAVEAERKGTIAYRAAGPDSPNRADNRHTAVACLKEARDIYQAALEQDSDSRDLDDRLKEVMQMLAQLRKDEGIDGR